MLHDNTFELDPPSPVEKMVPERLLGSPLLAAS